MEMLSGRRGAVAVRIRLGLTRGVRGCISTPASRASHHGHDRRGARAAVRAAAALVWRIGLTKKIASLCRLFAQLGERADGLALQGGLNRVLAVGEREVGAQADVNVSVSLVVALSHDADQRRIPRSFTGCEHNCQHRVNRK